MADPQSTIKNQSTQIAKLLAWGVHLYTASGLVAAAVIAVLLTGDHLDERTFRWVFLLMLAATLIDSTDGTLARRLKVKEVLAGFDGRRLDDLVDFLNYACLSFLLERGRLLSLRPQASGLALAHPAVDAVRVNLRAQPLLVSQPAWAVE